MYNALSVHHLGRQCIFIYRFFIYRFFKYYSNSMLENHHIYAPKHSLFHQKFKKIPFEIKE